MMTVVWSQVRGIGTDAGTKLDLMAGYSSALAVNVQPLIAGTQVNQLVGKGVWYRVVMINKPHVVPLIDTHPVSPLAVGVAIIAQWCQCRCVELGQA
ncbi:hypothetical protein SAMN02745746_01937 [Pseudogulbenkiania subflava DSM 22618]|uniref:Uncharacterized protein n=1 Tax=Pseudogulbenkiania subflava DSM 22618 TaxID=1123014 RepID=A0A1Y6BRM9_9NEIS|nr:hypothetical protein SAMN02745746_01937 [Pseudogulbenkiania subflava DSM 22618]